jgi:hypothetical protein
VGSKVSAHSDYWDCSELLLQQLAEDHRTFIPVMLMFQFHEYRYLITGQPVSQLNMRGVMKTTISKG